MKRKIPRTRLIITALIFGLAAILTTLAQRNAEATPPQASTEFDAIDDYVRGQLDDLRMPGAALGIVKDGEVVHLQTFRDASPAPTGTKSAESRHRRTVFRTDTGDDALEREVAKTKDVELTHDPGTTFQYSNRNYTTLGLLIKVVSGQSYEDDVQEHVLRPLSMNQSFMHLDDAKSHGLATGHQYWFNRPVPGGGLRENRAILPTGLITASVEDMSRWLIVHLDHGVYNGTRVLSAAGIDQLHAGVAPMTDKSRYAMGWYEADIASARS